MDDQAQTPDQTPQTAPSEPAEPVSVPAPATPEQTAQSENPTAQIPANEPIVIPPFDNSPTPLPQTSAPTSGAPASAPQAHSGRDLLVKARATIQDRKQKKLEKVLQLFATKEKITNDEVEKLLHVSDATATRYLSELEKQGAIKQVGRTGKAVVYTR
jgi:ribosomal protein S25